VITNISYYQLNIGCNETKHYMLSRIIKSIHLYDYVQPDQSLVLSMVHTG